MRIVTFSSTPTGEMLRPLLIIDHGSLQITKMHLEALNSGEITSQILCLEVL